jgi:hypothetical protein
MTQYLKRSELDNKRKAAARESLQEPRGPQTSTNRLIADKTRKWRRQFPVQFKLRLSGSKRAGGWRYPAWISPFCAHV